MRTETRDTFTAEELFLLVSAFGGETLFGLPDRKERQLFAEDAFKEAYQELERKNILDQEGKLTDGGGILIESLERYHQADSYIRFNQFLCGLIEEDSENVYVLTEITPNETYTFDILDKLIIWDALYHYFPAFKRTIPENEKEFLLREPEGSLEELTEFVPNERILSFESFHPKEQPQNQGNAKFYQNHLVFLKEEKLYGVNVVKEKIYQISGYWLLNKVREELALPL